MDTDKIIQDLNRKFAAPLPEFYQHRIIFCKKLLSADDLTTNYLVYSPCVYNRPDENWILDVELYSEEFRAGLDLNNNTVYQEFVKYHADAAFWAMVRQECGFVDTITSR